MIGSTFARESELFSASLGEKSYWAMGVGCLPLIRYHVHVLVPKTLTGISQAEIDSVYYFGFLITVGALCISAIMVGMNGATASVNSVVLHFGTGLFATAYAVIARLHLQSKVTSTSERTLEDAMDQYVSKSGQLVKNIEDATQHLAAFSRDIVARTADAAEALHHTANEKLLQASARFSEEIAITVEEARQGVHEFRVALNDTAFAAERQQYINSMQKSVGVAQKLNAAMADLLKSTMEELGARKLSLSATTAMATSMSNLTAQVQELGGPQGGLVQSASALREASSSMIKANTSIAGTVESLDGLLETVQSSATALKSVRTVSKSTTEHLDALYTSSRNVGKVAVHVDQLAESTKSLVNRVKSLDKVTGDLSLTAEELASNFVRVEAASSGLERDLARLPKHAEAVEAIGARVEKHFETIANDVQSRLADSSRQLVQQLGGYSRIVMPPGTEKPIVESKE